MKHATALAVVFASLSTLAGPAAAQSQGDWLVGTAEIDPLVVSFSYAHRF